MLFPGIVAVDNDRRHILGGVFVHHESDGHDATRHVLPVRVRSALALHPWRPWGNDFPATNIVKPAVTIGLTHDLGHDAVRLHTPQEELPPRRSIDVLPVVDGGALTSKHPRTLDCIRFNAVK